MLCAVAVKQVHQLFAVGAAKYVLRAVSAHIFFLHTGEVPVQLAIKVLAVAVA